MSKTSMPITRAIKGSPTERSLKFFRETGYLVEVTERWNHHARIRQDLFDCVDLLAVSNDEVVAVQATSRNKNSNSNMNARYKKIVGNVASLQFVQTWLAIPNHRFIIIGWGKYELQPTVWDIKFDE